jgi:hypothetical protein
MNNDSVANVHFWYSTAVDHACHLVWYGYSDAIWVTWNTWREGHLGMGAFQSLAEFAPLRKGMKSRAAAHSTKPINYTRRKHPPIINSSHPVIAYIWREMSNGLTQPERQSEKRRLLKGTESEWYLSIYGYTSHCSSVFWRYRIASTDELDLTIRWVVFGKISSLFWDFTWRRFVVYNF